MNNNSTQEENLNVIPSTDSNDYHKFDDDFMKNLENNNNDNINKKSDSPPPLVAIPIMANQNNDSNTNQFEDINSVIKPAENRFINDNFDTTLSSLNIENNHTDGPKIDYSKDPKVIENLNKRNTGNITSEGKVFIMIIIVLLIFIIVLPTVFEYVRNIKYN